MRRDELDHLARAAARVAGVRRLLVVGSQAVLGTYDADVLPPEAIVSIEADIVVLDDLDGSAHHTIEGALGYLSPFHTTYGYYAEGAEAGVAVLPPGWEGRVVSRTVDGTFGDPVEVYFPELTDLCISKLIAGRRKDLAYVGALVAAGLVDPLLLLDRARSLHGSGLVDDDLAAVTVQRAVATARRGAAG